MSTPPYLTAPTPIIAADSLPGLTWYLFSTVATDTIWDRTARTLGTRAMVKATIASFCSFATGAPQAMASAIAAVTAPTIRTGSFFRTRSYTAYLGSDPTLAE